MAYETIECHDVAKFWETLDPREPLGLGLDTSDSLVYRGQADSKWPLKPSAFRHNSKLGSLFKGEENPSVNTQIYNEWKIIEEFLQQSDIQGLKLPFDSSEFRKKLFDVKEFKQRFENKPYLWPTEEYLDILALAQHNELPTRLLDWTTKPYIAAYFAASSVIEKNDAKIDSFAVWVLNTVKLNNRIKRVDLPKTNNSNMSNQYGLFTIVKQQMTRGLSFKPITIDQIAAENYLRKLSLNKKNAYRILGYCKKHGINASSMYTGINAVVKGTIESIGFSDGINPV
jgi:hypothetical protein